MRNFGLLRSGVWKSTLGGLSPVRKFGSIAGTEMTNGYVTKVSQIVDSGAARYYSISQTKTVFEAVQQMVEHHCGSLIVKDGEQVVGIITERDYLTKIITMDRASKDTLVKEVSHSLRVH